MVLTDRAGSIQELVNSLHQQVSPMAAGVVADYIPELAKASPDDFGIVIVMVDGRIYAAGDCEKPFTIQSISKPFAYGLAVQLLSLEHMQSKVGVEPSGEAFNAISLDPDTGIPRNPMINAGAIATSAQIQQWGGEAAEKVLLDYFSRLAGRPLHVDQEVYVSERDTGHRNRAISHLLRNFNVIDGDVEAGLDLYFRQCAIQVTCRDLGVMAASLAAQGRNPLTAERALDPETTVQVLSLMGSCGMYDYAGQWLHDVGMPAKSGVGGGVLAVVPGEFGIATYSPPLDRYGNSVRGVAACAALSKQLKLHLYDANPLGFNAIRRCYTGSHCQSRCLRSNEQLLFLRKLADRLHVIHAQGVLGFAATEQLLAKLDSLSCSARVVILDLDQVQELPQHCSGLLLDGLTRLIQRGVAVVLSRSQHLDLDAYSSHVLRANDLDLALEMAESLLLQSAERLPPPAEPAASDRRLQLLDHMDAAHRQRIEVLLEPCTCLEGETIIRRGDSGDKLYFVLQGRFTTSVSFQFVPGDWKQSRLATFTPGMCFGEISFLNGQQRTADVVANEDSCCLVLSRSQFETLRQLHPETALELTMALAGELADRLGRTSYQLTVMEHL